MLDAMDSHGYRRWREARNFANRGGIHVFEIRDDHLPVERLEFLYPPGEAIQINTLVLLCGQVWDGFQIFETDQSRETSPRV